MAEQLETLPMGVYRALTRNSLLKPRLGPEMKLNDRVQIETMFVLRLSMEFDDAKGWLRGELELVRDLMRPPLRDEKPYSLADALEGALTLHLDHVRKHLDLVAKMFTDYIARRNVAVMYRLQRQVLFGRCCDRRGGYRFVSYLAASSRPVPIPAGAKVKGWGRMPLTSEPILLGSRVLSRSFAVALPVRATA